MTSIIVGGATTISNTGTLRIYNDSGNSIDGTQGDWEFVEGEAELYVINHKSNKKYKLSMVEV
jgi:hypothetical protein